ncbi:hypothetical protein HHL26_23775 [Sphingobium sp. TB-6]|uniref:hypothetical protein n=1 Tax=Sphingobium sp. TB-6 TaxID=2728850 RepID=UPI00146D2D05|nr:hypothetical protein [Sphingobium sp. TB-6]NML92022.1 hypothetical protein [Sphingobium sp. TB-6]
MIALFLLAATPSHFAYSILGEGSMSCGEWIDRRRAEPNRVLPEAAWVSGYITAMARIDSARNGRKIARGVEGAGIDHWIDNYCAAHPIDNVEAAASTLVGELKSRAQ